MTFNMKRQRANSSCYDEKTFDIETELGKMTKEQLKYMVEFLLKKSPGISSVAQDCIAEMHANKVHCLRCHEAFDPRFATSQDCVTAHVDGTVHRARNMYGMDMCVNECVICHEIQVEEGIYTRPCFVGSHVVAGSGSDFDAGQRQCGCHFGCEDCCSCSGKEVVNKRGMGVTSLAA